jgi:hypothetical protein
MFQNNYFSHETGDKVITVLLENTNEIQGMKLYDHCCSNKYVKGNIIKYK